MNGDEFVSEHPLMPELNTTTDSHNTKSKNHKKPKEKSPADNHIFFMFHY